MEAIERNNIDIYYTLSKELNDANAFNIITKYLLENKLINRGTVTNSCEGNELFLVNDNKGFYISGSGNIIECNITQIEEPNPNYSLIFGDSIPFITKYEIGETKKINYSELCAILCAENILKPEHSADIHELLMTKRAEINKNQDYIYMIMNDNKLQLEIIFKGKEISLSAIPKDWGGGYQGSVDFSFYEHGELVELSSDFNGFCKKYNENMLDKANLVLDNKVQKIDNGYVYNNIYYKKLEDVIDKMKELEEENHTEK